MIRRYDFKCTECNQIEEHWCDANDNFMTCRDCGETTQRVISAIRTHFVGHGWPDKDDKWAKDHERAANQ